MAENEKAEQIAEEVQNLLAQTLHSRAGAVLIKFIVLAEVIEPEGDRGIWMLVPSDMTKWDSIGMLEYARDLDRGLDTDE